MKTRYRASKISVAVALSMLASPVLVYAQEDDAAIEEVVARGSRLQGTAAAVIEERKNQAFVADILGAEQISRTGDGDAAAALRRVTGLTLVDGKFIYVRGLGERYSSARLNGAAIPSPDLTRNVIPLDIFPTSVIESLSVQKAYSPNMPAAFGGGNVDIRTKSVPGEFVGGIQVGVEADSNSSDGFTYNRNENGQPEALKNAVLHYKGDFSLASIINRDVLTNNESATAAQQATTVNHDLMKSLPRDMSITDGSLDPNYSIQAFIGDSYDEDWLGGTIGFLASVAYDNKWKYTERRNAVINPNQVESDCSTTLDTEEAVANSCFDQFVDSEVTNENERLNGLLNIGYRLGTHSISYNKIYIEDNEDEAEISILQNPTLNNTIVSGNRAGREHSFTFEERTLDVDQFRGQHTLLDYWGIGADWQYTQSEAETDIPLQATYAFTDQYDDNQQYVDSIISGGNGQVNYEFVEMDDYMKSWGGNVNLPISLGKYELEFRAGWDVLDRSRYYTTSSFFVNNTGTAVSVNDDLSDINGITSYLDNQFIDSTNLQLAFNEPELSEPDDYLAAQKVEAGYGSFDVIYDNTWRISGGLRFEDFKQVAIGTSSSIFTREDFEAVYSEENIMNGSVQQSDWYPSLSLTYINGDDYQLRFGYGETVVRPDLREVVPVGYFDPLTDIRTSGNTQLTASTLKNYDVRYELYYPNGDNLALSLFYKDIAAPIETILRIGDSSYTAGFTNGDTAELYGIEAEWLYDLSWLASGFFTSGNITLSDSEVTIDAADAGSLTNTTKRMNGHSEYVVNLQLSYDSADGEHSASLVYNVFGERILASGINGREDAFEQPFHSLDVVYSYYPSFNSTIKFRLKNLLGEDQEVTQNDIAVRTRTVGTTFNVSYKYDF
ncbi:TonB-dependent receptor plug domain-containing protein [Planctobacterium marinum]|uniref:TonB-dependent receptor plug domain-containing protein n=1 Tax=Planctobacterium marinum TaxID=1631968 RepID=UPI001E44EEDB|nr:TonB-dependent receptor plug domain-containing protein [Planctobacterium marinum]MCC2604979.1 TonB-dependent receptor [Planctobacterium marinum]